MEKKSLTMEQLFDQKICESVMKRLGENPLLDATRIRVSCSKGEVVLEGMVNDRHEKLLAERIAQLASGVKSLRSGIRLGQPSSAEAEDASDQAS